jgi:hypothetical protein
MVDFLLLYSVGSILGFMYNFVWPFDTGEILLYVYKV